MRRILIEKENIDPKTCSFGFPWKHDSICYNFNMKKNIANRIIVFLFIILVVVCSSFFLVFKIQFYTIEKKLNESINASNTTVECFYSFDDRVFQIYYTIKLSKKEFYNQAFSYNDDAVSIINKYPLFSHKKISLCYNDCFDTGIDGYIKIQFSNYDSEKKQSDKNRTTWYLNVWYNIEDYNLKTMDDIQYLKIQEKADQKYEQFGFLNYFPNLKQLYLIKSIEEPKDYNYIKDYNKIKELLPDGCDLVLKERY